MMSVRFHARVQPREDWCCVVSGGCGAVLPHGILLIDLKQQINNCRYWKGKWWRQTGQVIFGGWGQSRELVRLLQHTAAWPGLQAVFKAELCFPWVYNHIQKKKIFSLKSIVSFQTWAVCALFTHAALAAHPAGAGTWAFGADCHH